MSIPWIRKQILEYDVGEKLHNPRAINLVCDATFYGKQKDKLGTFVFKDVESILFNISIMMNTF